MNSLLTWRLVAESLRRQVPVMLLYVLESLSSSPGRAGFVMAVDLSGNMEGSLGGGIMEHKFIEMAKASLRENSSELSLHKQVHNKIAVTHQSGMICSGEQTILLYRMQQGDLPTIESLLLCMEREGFGALMISPNGLRFEISSAPAADRHFYFEDEKNWNYGEPVGLRNRLYIIGGGHCSLALSKLMRMLDFRIHVFDHRDQLKTMAANSYAHQKTILENYGSLAEIIPSGERQFVVIMTFGYRTDAEALMALIGKDFGYLGLLGSQAKVAKMFADLRAVQINENLISRVHAPVGLPIKSQTPEEVAVSIAAEIIGVKNG